MGMELVLVIDEEHPPQEYMSFNGMGRSPMLWGIPYMAGLMIVSLSLLPAMALGTYVHGMGWSFALIAVPLLIFARSMCSTDDKALEMLGKELKWALIKAMSGNAKYHGGTLTLTPTSYGRKKVNVERNFAAAIRG
jgi:type IV secretion system protein VirB3